MTSKRAKHTLGQTVEVLSRHGHFLQRYCASVLNRLGWKVQEEYPISFDYSRGSGVSVYDSSGDVLARLRNKQADYDLVIHLQAKRRLGKEWAFFPQLPARGHCFYPYLWCSDGHTVRRYGTIDTTRWKAPPLVICSIGREIDVRNAADTTEKEFGRDPIYLACREVAFSLNAMLRQDISDNESVAKVLPERVANFASHLPVVVTAASLQIIEFDSTKYDAEEKPTAKPQEVPCLVYKFPLHRHIQVPVEPEMPMERETLRYLDTFIVNYKSLEDFVRTLASYFDEHHAMMYRLF